MTEDEKRLFWSKVDQQEPGECWEWRGSRTGRGYGIYQFEKKSRPTHRLSYELCVGPIPDGLIICHHCDNPPCVNPRHLYAGTHTDNANDRSRRGQRRPVTKRIRVVDNNGPQYEYDFDEIERLLMLRGWTWNTLGREAGFPSPSTVYTVRDRTASRPTMKAVARAFDVQIETLIIEVDDTATKEPMK